MRSRKRTSRIRRIATLFLIMVAVSLTAYGGERARIWATSEGRFPIESIRIDGNDLLTSSEIQILAEVELGENLFLFDGEAAEARLESYEWFREVKVARRPPSGVVIRVIERTPWLLELREEGPRFVDRSGIRVEARGKEERLDLPLLHDDSGSEGGAVPALSDAFPPEEGWIAAYAAQIDIDKDGNVIIADLKGTKILMGTRPFGDKANRLRAVLKQWQADGQRFEEIDLRYKDQAVARKPITTGGR